VLGNEGAGEVVAVGSGVTSPAVEDQVYAVAFLNRLVGNAPFTVHVAKTFPLAQAADAQRMLDTHYLGKLALSLHNGDPINTIKSNQLTLRGNARILPAWQNKVGFSGDPGSPRRRR
jgi:NADPH:quinone reductase-like Zn-dependent oxidoreductase